MLILRRLPARIGSAAAFGSLCALLLLAWAPAAGSRPAELARVGAACDSGSGTLRVAVGGFGQDTMDPSLENRSLTNQHLLQMWDTLLEIGPKSSLAPGLATRWSMARDGKSWTFVLRQGVKFHNGEALTADDVRFSILRHMHPSATSTFAPALRTMVRRIIVVNPTTVRIVTHGVQTGLPLSLSPHQAPAVIYPKDYMLSAGTDFAKQSQLLGSAPIGSGPYRFVTRVRADCQLYRAVPGHWRATPEFESLQILYVPNEATQLAMLRSNQVDLVAVSSDNMEQARGARMRIVQVSRANSVGLHFSGTHRRAAANKPTANPLVRQALSLAIDRRTILKSLLGGQGVMSVTPYNTVPATADIDVKHYAAWAKQAQSYDPAAARQLLARAGYPSGFSGLKLFSHTQGGLFLPQVAEVVLAMWKQIGVQATLVPTTYVTLRPHIINAEVNDSFSAGDAYLIGAGPRFDSVGALSSAFRYEGGAFQLVKDTVLDGLVDKISAERDPAKRTKLASQAYDRANRSWTGVPLFDLNAIYAANPRTTGSWKKVFPAWASLGRIFENINKP